VPFNRRTRRQRFVTWFLCAISWLVIAETVSELRAPAPPPPILDRPVAHIDSQGADLAHVLGELRRQTGATIDVDWNALDNIHIHKNDTPHLHIESARLGAVLKLLFYKPADYGDYAIISSEKNRVHITTAGDQAPVVRVYDVSDLAEAEYELHRDDPPAQVQQSQFYSVPGSGTAVAGPPAADPSTVILGDVIDLITDQVRGGSKSPYEIVGRNLIFSAGPENQKKIADLLADLRQANNGKSP
jgi:hypothetical protein